MRRFGTVLASVGIAYYGVMIVAYLAKEAKAPKLVRGIAGTLTAYYAVMGIVYLNQEACGCGKANADSGALTDQ